MNPFESSPVPPGPTTYLSDSVIRFSPELKVLDWFTPSDSVNGQTEMDMHDRDLGSGGVMLLPDDDATRPLGIKLAVAAGKTGQMYLMDRASLGKFDAAGVNHVLDVQNIGPCFCGPSYFEGADGAPRIVSSGNGIVSSQPANGHLMVWRISIVRPFAEICSGIRVAGTARNDLFSRRFFHLCVLEWINYRSLLSSGLCDVLSKKTRWTNKK